MKRICVTIMAGLVACGLIGCNKITLENYNKIKNDMSQAQVEKILGNGQESSGAGISVGEFEASGKIVTWTKGDKSITVTFANGKVVAKAQQGL